MSASSPSTAKGFALSTGPALSRSAVDRREPLRDDAARARSLWPNALVLTLDSVGRTPVDTAAGSVHYRPALEFGEEPPRDAVLLGEDGELDYWAVRVADQVRQPVESPVWRRPDIGAQHQWLDLRTVGALLDDAAAGLFATAAAVLNWQRRSGFCARCGSAVEFRRSGWASYCERCEHEEYPRTDPAVICLVQNADAGRVLLARQPGWPAHRYSVLAGFVEAGESLEATVAREIAEEVGVEVGEIHYLGSQPWPVPRSLMLGFSAVADPDAPIVCADGE
ncbi:MAG: NAD(+) diphosphatase, partial [Sciscionella sp.]